MAMKYFAIFMWINDDPVTGNVLNLSNIVEPRKPLEEYKEFQQVLAKCPGYGLQRGVIGKISDESGKKALDAILAGPDFRDLVAQWHSECEEREGEKEENKETVSLETKETRKRKCPAAAAAVLPSRDDENDMDGVEMLEDIEIKVIPSKKTLQTRMKSLQEEAQDAKKEAAKVKRQKDRAMTESSAEMSLNLLSSCTVEGMEIPVAADLADIKKDIKTLASNQEKLIALIEPLLESIQCKQCLRSMYKGSKTSSSCAATITPQQSTFNPRPSTSTTPSTPRQSTKPQQLTFNPGPSTSTIPSTAQSSTTPQEDTMRTVTTPQQTKTPRHSTAAAQPRPLTESDDDNEVQDEGGSSMDDRGSMLTIENLDDLVYIGETIYGIRIKREDLHRCIEHSSTPEKLALNLLEFLVTAKDCQNMTVYGHGKTKEAMPQNMRRAIRSQIFSQFCKEKTEDEKRALWNEKIVYKMNDKIRGIKNGKYKSKK